MDLPNNTMFGSNADSHVDGSVGFVPLALAWGATILVGWFYVSLYSVGQFLMYDDYLGTYGALLQFGVMAFLILIHEGIHAGSFMLFGGLSWNEIEAKIALNPSGTRDPVQLYVYPIEPVRDWVYALSVAMPGIVLGVMPSIVGLATGHAFVMAVGLFGLGMTPIDVSVLFDNLRQPANGQTARQSTD